MFEHLYRRQAKRPPRPIAPEARVRITKKGRRLLAAHEARRWPRAA